MLAEKVIVSRQTVSEWGLNEIQPEMIKGRLLIELYGVTYDGLINDAPNVTKITDMEAVVNEIDWTNAWSEKYTILAKYHEDHKAKLYIKRIFEMYDEMKKEMDLTEIDTFLVMKDMVYQRYKRFTKKKNNQNYFISISLLTLSPETFNITKSETCGYDTNRTTIESYFLFLRQHTKRSAKRSIIFMRKSVCLE